MKVEDIQQAKRMRKQGMSYYEIGKRLEIRWTTVRRALDPEYAAQQRERERRSRERRASGEQPSRYQKLRADAERASMHIPRDTRTLTQRILGDPLPGRSAWCRKMEEV